MFNVELTVFVQWLVDPCIKVSFKGEQVSPWILPSGLIILLSKVIFGICLVLDEVDVLSLIPLVERVHIVTLEGIFL